MLSTEKSLRLAGFQVRRLDQVVYRKSNSQPTQPKTARLMNMLDPLWISRHWLRCCCLARQCSLSLCEKSRPSICIRMSRLTSHTQIWPASSRRSAVGVCQWWAQTMVASTHQSTRFQMKGFIRVFPCCQWKSPRGMCWWAELLTDATMRRVSRCGSTDLENYLNEL